MKISIVIPAYNEEKRIGNTLKTIVSYMDENYSIYEIIVVDDGSIDRTKDVVGFYKQAKYIAQAENMGKGATVRRGIMQADGGIIVFSDADLSTPIHELQKVLVGLKEGYDLSLIHI